MDFLGKIHHFCNVLVKEHSYIHTQFNSKSFSGARRLRFFYHVVNNMKGYFGPARLKMFGKTAFAGFFVDGWKVGSGLLHHSYDLVE